MYRLYYDHEANGDILFILLNPELEATSFERKDDVCKIFHEEELIGINIFNISNLIKIKVKGMIVTPNDEFIDCLNSLLINHGISPLSYCRDSGYKVGKVLKVDESPFDEKVSILSISLKDEVIETMVASTSIKVGDYLVLNLDGSIDFKGEVFHKKIIRNIHQDAYINSKKSLHLGEDSNPLIVEGYKEGDDFFLGGK